MRWMRRVTHVTHHWDLWNNSYIWIGAGEISTGVPNRMIFYDQYSVCANETPAPFYPAQIRSLSDFILFCSRFQRLSPSHPSAAWVTLPV